MADRVGSVAPAVLSQPELEAWGRGVGEAATAGSLALPLVVVMRGPLGAGKSVLARSIARGAGVETPMPSPTYNLLFTYDTGDVVIHHLDLYRLEDPDDVWELGWDEIGQGREIVLIEWPERAESLLPADRWEVRLGFTDHVDERRAVLVESRADAPDPPPLRGAPSGSMPRGQEGGAT